MVFNRRYRPNSWNHLKLNLLHTALKPKYIWLGMTHNKCKKSLNSNTIGGAHESFCWSMRMTVHRHRWCRKISSKVDSFGFIDENRFQRTRNLTLVSNRWISPDVLTLLEVWCHRFRNIRPSIDILGFFLLFVVSAEYFGVFSIRWISFFCRRGTFWKTRSPFSVRPRWRKSYAKRFQSSFLSL